MIKIKNLTKTYMMGDEVIKALDKVDLEIKKGEFVALIGPSGSGKSTLMNMVGALDYPDKGSIDVEEDKISKMTGFQRASYRNSKVGFIFQTFNLQGHLTALENVEVPLIFAGIRRGLRRKMSMDAMEKVDLVDRVDHRPSELSGGQQQRVSIARALVNKPEILLADEPTGNLDSKTGTKIIKILEQLNKEDKMTIIMVTHNEKHAAFADKVYHMVDGKIVRKKK
ncbi:MAG: ABC transporter ATP-binding protein [Candidatus Heimdallarchaeaceae archaeon]